MIMKGFTIVRTAIVTAVAVVAFTASAQAQSVLTLNVEPEGSGYVARFPGADGFVDGNDVTVTATPEPGYEFVGFEGDVESTDSSITFTLSEDMTVTAVFQEVTHEDGVELYQLSAFVEPSGAGTIVRAPALFDYEDGEEVTLEAYAGEGFVFTGWSGDLPEGESGENAVLVLSMTGDLDVRANFSAALTVDEGDEGDGTAACGSIGAVGMGALVAMMLSLKLGRGRRW